MFGSFYTMYASTNIIFIVVPVLFQGCVCPSPATGHWYKCADKYYYLGVKRSSWYDSLQFCGHLFNDTRVANFGTAPVDFTKRCKFHLLDKRQYWIECWYGQPQSQCTILTKKGRSIKTHLSSCSSLAYPICETSKVPIKTVPATSKTSSAPITRKPTPVHVSRKPTSVPVSRKPTPVPVSRKPTPVPVSRKQTLVPITRKPSPASITRKPSPTPTTRKASPVLRKTTTVHKTNKTTSVSTTPGWLTIAKHSYFVTQTTYNYSDAMKACLRVNSTLADMHSIRNISRIVVELGLRRRANLKNWIKGTRQRKERLLQLNGQSQFAFVSGALSLKHLAICERNINTKKLSTILQSLSPTTGTSAKRPTPSAMPILSVTPAKSMSSSYVSSKTSKNGTLSTMTISSENTSLSTSQRGALPIPSIMSMTSTTSAKSVLSANASLSKPQRESTSARSTINSLVSNALALISNPPGNTVPGATGSKRSDSWIKIDAHECYVNHDVNNYTSAEKYCKRTLNASLMTFVSSIQYFQVLSQLNLSDGSYWIGANNNNNIYKPIECLSYHRYSNTMSISNCTRGMFSVCSRYINNVTEILESAAFRLLLKDMTVNKTDTSVNKRKRISMNTDHRWSVQAAGGISLFVICLTVTLPLMIDFTRLARYRKKRL